MTTVHFSPEYDSGLLLLQPPHRREYRHTIGDIGIIARTFDNLSRQACLCPLNGLDGND